MGMLIFAIWFFLAAFGFFTPETSEDLSYYLGFLGYIMIYDAVRMYIKTKPGEYMHDGFNQMLIGTNNLFMFFQGLFGVACVSASTLNKSMLFVAFGMFLGTSYLFSFHTMDAAREIAKLDKEVSRGVQVEPWEFDLAFERYRYARNATILSAIAMLIGFGCVLAGIGM